MSPIGTFGFSLILLFSCVACLLDVCWFCVPVEFVVFVCGFGFWVL